MLPLLKLVPLSDTTVCAVVSIFIQVTSLPGTTVIVDGLNCMDCIVTVFSTTALVLGRSFASLVPQEFTPDNIIIEKKMVEKNLIVLISFKLKVRRSRL